MTGSSRRKFLRTAGVGAVGFAGGLASGRTLTSSDSPDGHEASAADIGFCTDMTMHHLQALAMCQRVIGRDTGDPVQAAATEVLQTQAIEIGMMRAWLADWGESTNPPEMVMGWMGMNDGDGMPLAMMPGLASDEEMRQLSQAEGLDGGRMWLELMRTHHIAGVDMANAAVDLVDTGKVQRLARIQAEVQTFEIGQYDLLLATEYA